MSKQTSKAQGIADAAIAREELYGTLAQLKDQLNYARRFDEAVERTEERVQRVREERPAVFITGVVSVAVVTGTLVWAVVNRIARGRK